MSSLVLDPAAATLPAHGQIACSLTFGGLSVSAHKIVDEGMRAQVITVPGLFRFDVRALDDTLDIMSRPLNEAPIRWTNADLAAAYDKPAGGRLDPVNHIGWRFAVDLPDQSLEGSLELRTTADRTNGVFHFVAHAVVVHAVTAAASPG